MSEKPLIDTKRRWMGPVIAGSVILNVFLVGFVAARLITPDASSPRHDVEFSMGSLPDGLSEEARERLEDQIRDRQEEMNVAYERLIESRERVNEILTSDDIDALALERELGTLRRLQMEIQDPIHRAFVEATTEMNREARREMMRARRVERVESMRLPRSVDGVNWRFSVEDDKIKLDVDIEGLEGIEDLESLENFEITFDVDDNDEWWLDDDEEEASEEDEETEEPEPPGNFPK